MIKNPYPSEALKDRLYKELDETEETALEVKFAAYANWFTSHGVYLKQKHLASEGFPMCENWFMITTTCSQTQFCTAEEAYDFLLDAPNGGNNNRVAKYTRDVSKKLTEWGYFKDAKHCVNWRKLEFQQNGWPHWHIFINLTERVTKSQLNILRQMWKYGRARWDQLDSNAHYAFKYAFKCPFKKVVFDPDGNMTIEECKLNKAVPDWFSDKYEIIDGKPFTYDRARFFQRSRGFMENHKNWLRSKGSKWKNYKVIKPVKPSGEPTKCTRPITVRERLNVHLSRVQFTARTSEGDYIKSCTTILSKPFHVFVEEHLVSQLVSGAAVAVHPHHYSVKEIPDDYLTPLSKLNQKYICQKNKLTVSQAQRNQNFLRDMRISGLHLKGELSRSIIGKIGKINRKNQNQLSERQSLLV